MTELARLVEELLDPLKGVELGLMSGDSASLLLNIRAGELRKIGTCLRLVRNELLPEISREAGLPNKRPASNQ